MTMNNSFENQFPVMHDDGGDGGSGGGKRRCNGWSILMEITLHRIVCSDLLVYMYEGVLLVEMAFISM